MNRYKISVIHVVYAGSEDEALDLLEDNKSEKWEYKIEEIEHQDENETYHRCQKHMWTLDCPWCDGEESRTYHDTHSEEE